MNEYRGTRDRTPLPRRPQSSGDDMTLDELVDAVSVAVPASVVVVDRNLRLLSYGEQAQNVDACRVRSILDRRCSPATRTWFAGLDHGKSSAPFSLSANPDLGAGPRICVPLASGAGRVHGYMFLAPCTKGSLSGMDVQAALPYAAVAANTISSMEVGCNRLNSALVLALTEPAAATQESVQMLEEAGFLGRGRTAVVLAMSGDAPSAIADVRSVSAAMGRFTAILAVATGDFDAITASVAMQFASKGNVVGVSAPVEDASGIGAAWKQAQCAARVAQAIPAQGPVAFWNALGVYRLAACGDGADLAAAVLTDPVRALLDHPNPDLWQSALTYLDSGGDVAATSASLGVHRQTVYYRLAKAADVAHCDLRDGGDRMLLHLGLTVGRLAAVENASNDLS
jgi:hypothetical protein